MEQTTGTAASGRGGRRVGARNAVAVAMLAALAIDALLARAARVGARKLLAVGLVVALAMASLASAVGGDPDPASGPAALEATPVPASGGALAPAQPSTPTPTPTPTAAPAGATAPVPVSVSIDGSHPGRRVVGGYLGLSFEATDLRRIAEYGGRGDLVGLLRSLGPGVLRFGGVSADTRIAWTDAKTPRPAWTSAVLEAGDLRLLARLARESHWHVLLTVGLAHYDPSAAAREVAAAAHTLGPWLSGIEIGNEPDAYARHGLRGLPWTFERYDAEVRAYRRAIAKLAPGIPLAGPGVSGSHVFMHWGPSEARTEHPALLTGHHYPLGCHQQPTPSITQLLSPQVRVMEGDSLFRYMEVARATGLPFRMDEANSVSCGGSAGISNTFAAALWATGYIGQSLAAGVSGLNFQGNPANCLGYSAVCAPNAARLATGGLTAQPLWYALLMMRGLVGARTLRTTVSTPQPQNLAVTTFVTRAGALVISLVDDEPPGSQPTRLSLRVGPRFGTASVLTMTAPSLEATSGVTLGGRTVARDGSWSEPADTPRLPVQEGTIDLTLMPSSAELVTATPAG
ncbi:MAG TPA: glycosyl hydrolase family 79 C-terminal domain-containing protein [Solirubrobacteraceae bacterium]|nr:glycosyl hydrolase family 79 C-terminal domain-containing protein [Solirubrobacteraceae bacterium]